MEPWKTEPRIRCSTAANEEIILRTQTGIWHFDGRTPDVGVLRQMNESLGQFGADGYFEHQASPAAFACQCFHVDRCASIAPVIHVSDRENVVVWDGRLDNRSDLVSQFNGQLSDHPSDAEIVARAFDRWSTRCFEELIGDWAVTIFEAKENTLFLARDFVGVRPLYYHLSHDHVLWSSNLGALSLNRAGTLILCPEYFQSYIVSSPDPELTPFAKIRAVPPGGYVMIKNNVSKAYLYWNFDPTTVIRYRSDRDYEEHFRYVLRQAIRRRLHSDYPTLAELSGGLDSSSIVCLADSILEIEGAPTPRIDTISYYNQEEPTGDERPFFAIVEQKRRRVGSHINAAQYTKITAPEPPFFSMLPGASQASLEFDADRSAVMAKGNNRVLLSGLGGDEVLGGVPRVNDQLLDLLIALRFPRLHNRIKVWGVAQNQPYWHMLGQMLASLIPDLIREAVVGNPSVGPWVNKRVLGIPRKGPWLQKVSVERQIPSRRGFLMTWAGMCSRMGTAQPPLVGCCEFAYPYLDRSLMEFLYAIPWGQVVRPGERRSLMRRALASSVPTEIIRRKSKGVSARIHILAIESERKLIGSFIDNALIARFGYVDPALFRIALQETLEGRQEYLVSFLRCLRCELFLRGLVSSEISDSWSPSTPEQCTTRRLFNRSRTDRIFSSRTQVKGGEHVRNIESISRFTENGQSCDQGDL
jgi:asparagine synthase (glutamine-hydrolysing)